MIRILTVTLAASCLVFITGTTSPVRAQLPQELSKGATDTVVTQLADILKQVYFHPEKRVALDRTLQKKLKSGEFYHLTPDTLARRITKLLRAETHDIHFYLGHQAPQAAKASVDKAPSPAKENFNGGFVEAKILENNIGYIRWVRCIADEQAFKKIVSVLEFLQGCDHLIIDISENPGGDGRSSGFINQHLYAATDYQNLLIKKCTGEPAWHQSEVPYNYTNGPRFFDVPLYVIVSDHTASAAEYFAFITQEMKRGTILGKTTAGAGNPITMVSFNNYFLYVPVCEITTKDGKSIEAKGVVPDVALTSDDWVKETVEYIKAHSK